jgi:hypothetical protein
MTPAERHLAWFMRFTAVMFLLALFAVVMPTAWMAAISEWYGLTLPAAPLVEYLSRSVSAVYATMGASYWYMARDVRRYLPLLRFSLGVMIVFDVVVIILDVVIAMPLTWTVGEAVSVLSWTAAFWWLLRRVPDQA